MSALSPLFVACYAEVHFENYSFILPTSSNPDKFNLLATERVPIAQLDYLKAKYPKEDIEICLLDTNIGEDGDWLESYENKAVTFEI